MKMLLPLALLLAGSAVAQENPGQMGATPKPAATTPSAPQAKGAQPANPPDQQKPESAAPPTTSASPTTKAPEKKAEAPLLQMSDSDAAQLQAKIQQALRNNSDLHGASLSISVTDNSIDLTGNTNNARERMIARRIVQSFAGNRKVRESISVAGSPPIPDTEAASKNPTEPMPQGPGAQPKPDQNKPLTDPKKDGDKSENPR